MSSLLRFKMVDAAINHTAVEVKAPEGRPSDYFGKRVFGRAAMRKYLNKATYDALVDTMENGTPLTRRLPTVSRQACASGRWSTVPTTIPIGSSP